MDGKRPPYQDADFFFPRLPKNGARPPFLRPLLLIDPLTLIFFKHHPQQYHFGVASTLSAMVSRIKMLAKVSGRSPVPCQMGAQRTSHARLQRQRDVGRVDGMRAVCGARWRNFDRPPPRGRGVFASFSALACSSQYQKRSIKLDHRQPYQLQSVTAD